MGNIIANNKCIYQWHGHLAVTSSTFIKRRLLCRICQHQDNLLKMVYQTFISKLRAMSLLLTVEDLLEAMTACKKQIEIRTVVFLPLYSFIFYIFDGSINTLWYLFLHVMFVFLHSGHRWSKCVNLTLNYCMTGNLSMLLATQWA